MKIKTYFDKSNTIVKNSNVNTGLNPIAELFYGDTDSKNNYSRHLFHFDETRIKNLYDDGTFPDLTKLKHTLVMMNTGSFDKSLLNGTMGSKARASSFDLMVFKIGQDWDSGVGYDYDVPILAHGDSAFANGPSNWVEAQTGVFWSGGTGVFSGSSSGITIGTQHFDKGNENIEIDITDYVNGVLTGDTNYGLGLSYTRPYEILQTISLNYVGFFTNNTQTFFEPYIETYYENHIKDDRFDFYLDKPNKLYLYVNLLGQPTNLDVLPSVEVRDSNGNIFATYLPENVNHVTKGVYSIDILVPTSANECTMYNDIWSGITINGVSRPNISLEFALKDSMGYYNIGDSSSTPKKANVTISGIQNNEKIKRGDVRKIFVTPKIPYTVNQTQVVDSMKYRIYTLEGVNELTSIEYTPVEMTNPNAYFLLDTMSFLSGIYYIDVIVESNLEITTLKNVSKFTIVNQTELRRGN